MKISFTQEEIQEVRKFASALGIDITSFGGLSESKTTLLIKPTTVCKQIAIRRHDICPLGPIKLKTVKSHILNYLMDNFEDSMLAK